MVHVRPDLDEALDDLSLASAETSAAQSPYFSKGTLFGLATLEGNPTNSKRILLGYHDF